MIYERNFVFPTGFKRGECCMSEKPQNERWREDAWRPRLTPAERERLRALAGEGRSRG